MSYKNKNNKKVSLVAEPIHVTLGRENPVPTNNLIPIVKTKKKDK